MRPAVKPAGPSSGLGTLLIACAATLFVASRLWTSSREVHHLREELAAVHTSATSAALQHQPQQQQQQQQLQPTPAAGAGSTIDAGDGLRLASAAEEQPLLFYSVRAQPPPGQEAPPLDGPPLDADTLPLSSDPDGKLLGQVNLVEAGRVHGWACVKGSQADALTVTVYVDGVQVGASQAVLPTQTSHVRQLCQLDPPGGAAAAAEEALQEAALHVGRGGVGFVVPLPPLAEGLHVLRVFVAAPAAAFRQELNQSPLLFRESSISPDQEERIRRKDAIIQTRNAQVAALWDELHTKLPWRNAVAGRKPIQPFPAEQEEEDRRQAAKQGNQTDLVLFIAVNTGLTSRKRRDILRKTWVPSGRLDEVEARLGVRIRFFLGYSQQKGDSVEKELQAEMREFGDMERLDIQDEYSELSRKTARLFSQMSSSVRADFYFKIDDDVAVNVEALAAYLKERRQLGNLYLGCMKSGEVLTDKRWKWYEPEHWRFGDPAGKDDKVNYMRHASGQIYGMSRPVARYIAQNEAILHRFANEDVSVGAWLMGLDIVYDNNRRLCCDTEWKCTQQSGSENVCLAFSENQCAGLCRSEERLEGIYKDCVLDAYQAGKKGKLPWWGQSGWATAGRNAGGAQADKVEEAKNVTQKAGDKAAAGAATTTAAGTAAGTMAGTTAGAAAGTAAGTAGAAANAAAGTAAGAVTNATAGAGAAGAAGAGTGS